MIDYINYYYDLYPSNIENIGNKYMFSFNSFNYALILYERDMDELEDIINLNRYMINTGSIVSEIIITKYNNPLISYQNNNYILIRYYVLDRLINIYDIFDIIKYTNIDYNSLNRCDWSSLWEVKIDYFEYQMTHILKKYPLLNNTIDYYIGISENAISYFKYVDPKSCIISISHKRIGINTTLFDLYNPLNLIIDYRIRDIAEYIKDCFFNNVNVLEILDKVYDNFYIDKNNMLLLVSRLLFSSYYFDMYEYIVSNDIDENIILDIIKKSSQYEDFIHNIIIKNNLININWIK